jgi:cobalt/nickel transport system ATP-binding protein
VRVFGVDIDKKNVGEIRKKVGLVFQDADSQLFSPTVLEDVMFGPLNLGMSPEDAKKRAEWALGVVGIKELNKIPHYLSGGQQRLVAIAGVLAMEPRILVVDEPTGDLDPSNAMRIEALLRSLREEHGISVVVALHDMDMAARLADRICIVREGSVIAEGKPENILYDDALLKSAGLEMPAVARLYRDLDLEKKGMRRPLSLDDLVPMLKGPKAAASVRKKQRTGEGV